MFLSITALELVNVDDFAVESNKLLWELLYGLYAPGPGDGLSVLVDVLG
jgi:hypothetical protein